MKDYKIRLKIISPLTSYFYADTLAGILMYIFSFKNKDLFDYFYNRFVEGDPPFVFSSILPDEHVPFNINFFIDKLIDKENENYKDEKKILKKIRFIPRDWLKSLSSKKIDDFKDLARYSLLKKTIRFHNNIDKKELFFIDNFYFLGNKADVYLRIFDEEKKNQIIDCFEEAISFYLGKKKTAGYNNFKIENIQEFNLPKNGDYFLNLSIFNPSLNDKENYQPVFFDFKIKYPKTGELFSFDNPFKKKIVLIEEGSVFRTKRIIYFLGKIIKNVSYIKKEIIQIPITIPFYFNYE